MSDNILKVAHLYHKYSTDWAIQDISFEISQHGILGLLGSNGAGKSTTMNILCGVLNQTSGKVYVQGTDMRKDPLGAKRAIGFLPQNAPLYHDLTVDEYLTHCAHLRKIPTTEIKKAVAEAKERCGVTHFSKRLISNLSGGYRQRVGIAQAIIHKPALVVLDEPTNGLDPNQITEVRLLIKEIAQQRAVIFSTHILSEVQATCKDIKMIEGGKMVFSDTLEAFNNYIQPTSMIARWQQPPSEAELLAIDGITAVSFLNGHEARLHFAGPPAITEKIVALSVDRGWRLGELTLEKSSLDEIFAQLSKKN